MKRCKTITSALNSLPSTITDNYQINVADGTYTEHLNINLANFGSHSLTITSDNGNANCIVDGRNNGDIVTIIGNGFAPFTIQGFKIQNAANHTGIRPRFMGNVFIRENAFITCNKCIEMEFDFGNSPNAAEISGNQFYLPIR